MSSETSIYVHQGTVEVSGDDGVVLTTLLGSCVAACLWDPVQKVGGMNHLLLPPENGAGFEFQSQNVNLMELLINGLLRKGAERDRLKVKLFGGSSMIDGLSNVGKKNSDFARNFFENEAIEVVSESLGGTHSRRVQFWPINGRARQRVVEREQAPIPKPEKVVVPEPECDIELF